MAYTIEKGRVDPMRLPIWRIRALVIVALLFIAGSAAAQGVTREQLIGTWWYPANLMPDESESSEAYGAIIVRIRDDGSMTFSFEADSYQFQMLYARWELEDDRLTFTPVRVLGETEPPDPPSIVMIAFEGEALNISDPASGFTFLTMQPGVPPEAVPEGNALSGTVTYSDGPFDEIVVVAYRFESMEGSEDMFPVVGGAAVLLEQGEWRILGLDDGAWSVEAIVLRHSGDSTRIVGGSVLSGGVNGSLFAAVNDGSYDDGSNVVAKTAPPDLSNSFSLQGGQHMMGIDLAPMASGTAVEATTWGEVKARSR